MALQIDWDQLLDQRYPSYKVEVNAFLDSLEVSSSPEISIEKIYYAIKDDSQVNENLLALYHEAVFGSNKDVKLRMRNRMSNFKRSLKGHPKVKKLDMLHASDYTKMDLKSVDTKLRQSKRNDDYFAKKMQDEVNRKRKVKQDAAQHANATEIGQSNAKQTKKTVTKRQKIDDDGMKSGKENAISPFPSDGISKPSCVSVDHAKEQESSSIDLTSIGPCALEYAKCKDVGDIPLEAGDIIYKDNESEEDASVHEDEIKIYGKKDMSQIRKKLIPKKSVPKYDTVKRSNAQKEFDKIMKQKEVKNNDSFTSEEESIQINQLNDAFKKTNVPVTITPPTAEDEKVLGDIRRATTSITKSTVETTAYLRALGQSKGLDVDKFRKEVQEELQEQD